MKKLLLAILLVSQLAIYGQQKVYTDRTELEGVDLPSAGQTRNIVIGDDKKISSEAKPTIPAQLNPTAGTGISISGTYPNLTFTNISPNVAQSLDDVLGVGNDSDKNIKLIKDDDITDLKPESVVVTNIVTNDVTTITSDKLSLKKGGTTSEIVGHTGGSATYTHTLQSKSGTIAHVADIPSFTGYATEGYVANYRPSIVLLDNASDSNLALINNRFNNTHVFKSTTSANKTIKIEDPATGNTGATINIINGDDTYNLFVEVWSGSSPDLFNISDQSSGNTITIPPLSGVEAVSDGTAWYFSVK